MSPSDKETFQSLRVFILDKLSTLNDDHQAISQKLDAFQTNLNERLSTIHVDIATLKVKAGVWGLVGGILAAGTGAIIQLLSSKN